MASKYGIKYRLFYDKAVNSSDMTYKNMSFLESIKKINYEN